MIGSSEVGASRTIQNQKRIIKQLLNSYDVSPGKTHVGVITYSNPPLISLEMGKFKNRKGLYKQIDEVDVTGKGNLADALKTIHNGLFSPLFGARPDFRKSLVVFVDGYLNADIALLNSTGEELKNKGISMVVIDVSSDVESSVLKEEKSPFYDVFSFPPHLNELDIALHPVIKTMQPGLFFTICVALNYLLYNAICFSFL